MWLYSLLATIFNPSPPPTSLEEVNSIIGLMFNFPNFLFVCIYIYILYVFVIYIIADI